MKYEAFKKTMKHQPDLRRQIAEYLKPFWLNTYHIGKVGKVFREYNGIEYPNKDKPVRIKQKESYTNLQFIAVCLFIFDPETINPVYNKKMRHGIREAIAVYAGINAAAISNKYLPRARVYMKVPAYETFAIEVMQMVAIIKAKHTKK